MPAPFSLSTRLWLAGSESRILEDAPPAMVLCVTHSTVGPVAAKLSDTTVGLSLAVGAKETASYFFYLLNGAYTPGGPNDLLQLSWKEKLGWFQRRIVEISWCDSFEVLDTSVGSIYSTYATFLQSILLLLLVAYDRTQNRQQTV